jgi:hypothetical protein
MPILFKFASLQGQALLREGFAPALLTNAYGSRCELQQALTLGWCSAAFAPRPLPAMIGRASALRPAGPLRCRASTARV